VKQPGKDRQEGQKGAARDEVVPADSEGPPGRYNAPIPNALDLGWYYSETKNQLQMAKIAQRDRATHMYVVGASGSGKTKFLEFLIAQDIEEGNGFGVIDPHGDLIEDIKGILACRYHDEKDGRELAERTVLIDPTDPEYTAIFNPLEELPNTSAAEQANELVGAFRRIWSDSWGVRMEDLLRNALIALGEARCTLPDLPAFLTRQSYRAEVMQRVRHPVAWEYFQGYDALTERAQSERNQPVMNKVNAFLSDDRIRAMLSAPKSTFNIREIMDQGMILLVNLDKGKLKGAGDLLGSLLMAKLQMAAFSRSDVLPNRRRPFYLYVDEFQNYASDSFEVALSEARKYGLSLTMAHQTLGQISNELRSLILGNAGIQVYFRLNRQDAQLLAKEIFEYSGFEVKYFHSHSPTFWSLGEEWERKTAELQRLPLRVCLAKHKIEGGLVLLHTADMNPPWQVLGMDIGDYLEFVSELPFGRGHLVPRRDLPLFTRGRVAERAAAEVVREPPTPTPPSTTSPERKPRPDKEATAPARERAPVAVPPAGEGKGGRQHKYLQNLIKKLAEENGWRAIIEKPTPDAQGQVDISLEQDGSSIACEVSVTTGGQQELGNVRKCLAAGYDQVILCSPDKGSLQKLEKVITKELEPSERERVLFLDPEGLLAQLSQRREEDAPTEQRIKGYKVKVRRQLVDEADEQARREAIAQVIVQSMKRLRDED